MPLVYPIVNKTAHPIGVTCLWAEDQAETQVLLTETKRGRYPMSGLALQQQLVPLIAM